MCNIFNGTGAMSTMNMVKQEVTDVMENYTAQKRIPSVKKNRQKKKPKVIVNTSTEGPITTNSDKGKTFINFEEVNKAI